MGRWESTASRGALHCLPARECCQDNLCSRPQPSVPSASVTSPSLGPPPPPTSGHALGSFPRLPPAQGWHQGPMRHPVCPGRVLSFLCCIGTRLWGHPLLAHPVGNAVGSLGPQGLPRKTCCLPDHGRLWSTRPVHCRAPSSHVRRVRACVPLALSSPSLSLWLEQHSCVLEQMPSWVLSHDLCADGRKASQPRDTGQAGLDGAQGRATGTRPSPRPRVSPKLSGRWRRRKH